MANQQNKITCTVCGSTFFTTIRAEQFIAGGYGTAEFRSISNAPKTVLQCIGCGTPVNPKPGYYSKGTVAGVAEDDFRKSVEMGRKYRETNSIQNIVKIAVSPSELREVREFAEDIKRAVEAQAKPKASKKLSLIES